jgi:hypothetical protein
VPGENLGSQSSGVGGECKRTFKCAQEHSNNLNNVYSVLGSGVDYFMLGKESFALFSHYTQIWYKLSHHLPEQIDFIVNNGNNNE